MYISRPARSAARGFNDQSVAVLRGRTKNALKQRGVSVYTSKVTTDEKAELRTIDSLPVERGLPLLGIMTYVMDASKETSDLFDKHGADTIYANIGPAGYQVMYLSPDDIDCVLSDSETFEINWAESTQRMIFPDGKQVLNKDAGQWRSAMGRIMSKEACGRLHFPLMKEEMTSTIKKLVESGEECLFYNEARRTAYRVACRAAVGDLLSNEDLDYLFPYAVANGEAAFTPNFGLKNGVPFTKYWKGAIAKGTIVDYLTDKLEVAVSKNSFSKAGSAIEPFIEWHRCKDSQRLSDRELARSLAEDVVLMVFAGTDTSTLMLARSAIQLCRYPEWMERLRAEQERLMAEYGDELTPQVLSKSAIAVAFAQEMLRLQPPIELLFRTALKDTVVGGVSLPAGTNVTLSVRKAIKGTGNGSDKFDPDFWLSDDRREVTANDAYANFVFGRGARSCVGRNLFMTEVITYLAIIVREVGAIEMSREELNRNFFLTGHPTGLPLKLTSPS